MEINKRKLWMNKTWRFLIPSFKSFGGEFLNRFNSTFKLAVGIHDSLLDGSEISENRTVFILFNKEQKGFTSFINYVRFHPYFIVDYCPDSDIVSSEQHMVVMRIHDRYKDAYDKFLKSLYSEMYSEEELEFLFSKVLNMKRKDMGEIYKNKLIDYEILSHTGIAAKNLFKKTLEDKFGYSSNSKFPETSIEWELPLVREEEIFHCLKDKRVYFRPELDKYGNTLHLD